MPPAHETGIFTVPPRPSRTMVPQSKTALAFLPPMKFSPPLMTTEETACVNVKDEPVIASPPPLRINALAESTFELGNAVENRRYSTPPF